MKRLFLLLLTLTGFAWTAAAQSVGAAADALRDNLKDLGRNVESRLSGDRAEDILRALEKTRGDLERLHDGVAREVPRSELASEFRKVQEHFYDAMTRLGDRRFADAFRGQVNDARRGMVRLEDTWNTYNPVPTTRRPGRYVPVPPPVINRDGRARELAIDYLQSRLRVRSSDIEVTKLEQIGNRYRVFSRVRGLGGYVTVLDPLSGTIFSSGPVR